MIATTDAPVSTSAASSDLDATATTAGWLSRLKLDKFEPRCTSGPSSFSSSG